jgi:hypothetical protein
MAFPVVLVFQANLEFPEVQEKKEIVAENSHVSQLIAEKKEHQEDQEEMAKEDLMARLDQKAYRVPWDHPASPVLTDVPERMDRLERMERMERKERPDLRERRAKAA